MLIALIVTLWQLSGLLAIHLAFAAARRDQEIFDPIHIWLAVLGPVSLILACLTLAEQGPDPRQAAARQLMLRRSARGEGQTSSS